jgi:hypothetical protein
MRRLPLHHLIALALLAGCAIFLFRLSLFEGWAFVGDSDRLNSVLNTRLFEIGAVQKWGRVPFWSDQQFMGYSVVGLHWMLTTFSPLPYLLALLPTSEILHVEAAITALQLALTLGATYWLLGAYSTHVVARVVGALLFGLGAFTLHKLSQLDVSFLAITAMPVLLLLVRETRRETAARTFLLTTLLWAALVGFTILQEIAYVTMLFSAYALYRSVRLRSCWPVLVAGLAFVCAVTIAAPRVLTVATEIPETARTTVNFQTAPVESLRYFGDGLLGRTRAENLAVRGADLNLHEGVQVMTSALGAWAAIVAGLLARSAWARTWGIGLLLVLSIALSLWWRPFYDSIGRWDSISRELRVVLVNGVLIGAPLWLVGWLVSGAQLWTPLRMGRRAEAPDDETPAARQDTPFFLLFSALGMAAVLLPEARTVLYYGFMRLDFQHARLTMAITLPLAVLVTILLSRFLPTRLGSAALRFLVLGLILGLVLWLAREIVAASLTARLGEVLEAARPRRVLTAEAVRVGSSLLVLLIAVSLLLVRRTPPGILAVAGGVLAAWMTLESLSAAEFRLNGPHVLRQQMPFEDLNYLAAPPGRLRVPTDAERAALRARLETDQYRVVLQQEPSTFPALIEPHIAAFWELRLVEGYSTGLPRRFELLPWQEGVTTPHHMDLNTRTAIPWQLLAALNVKHLVVVDQSLWYNPAPGDTIPPLDPQQIEVHENPFPVAPRAFFAARVTPAGPTPQLAGDSGERPAPADPPIVDPREQSVAEGLSAERSFGTVGAVNASFEGDRVRVRVEPAAEDRFLVLNERYYPGWRATVDGRPTEVYATNIVMRGLIVPAGATSVEFQYVPFLATGTGLAVLAVGVVMTALVWFGLRYATRSTAPRALPVATPTRPDNTSERLRSWVDRRTG